jgi:PilZ domain-containing protein
MTRSEKRIPMAVAVRIEGHPALPGVETTFTEDVCSRGAKVYSARRWKAEEHLHITTLGGDFHSVARVAWCSPSRDAGFAIGLQFVEPSGNWVIASSVAS